MYVAYKIGVNQLFALGKASLVYGKLVVNLRGIKSYLWISDCAGDQYSKPSYCSRVNYTKRNPCPQVMYI